MIYDVDVDDGAKASIDDYISYLAVEQQAPQAAQVMLDRIWSAIDSVGHWPRRCSRAPEDKLRDYEIRMILVDPCIVLFTINDDTKLVTIIAFRHGRQQTVGTLPEMSS